MVKEYYVITTMDGKTSYLVYETSGRYKGLTPLNDPNVNDDGLFSRVIKLKNLEDLKRFDKSKELSKR